MNEIYDKSGFFYVPLEDNDREIVNDLINIAKKYFNDDINYKNKHLINKNGVGFSCIGKKTNELKELFTYRCGEINCEYNDIYNKYCSRMHNKAIKLFENIIKSLGCNINDYNHIVQPSLDTLTLLHYPLPINNNILGCLPHTDWGLLTFLYTDEIG